MLPNNATVLSTESAAEILARARAFNVANIPPITNGKHYFLKTDTGVALESGQLVNTGEFIESDTELTAAKARSTLVPIYDINNGAKHVYTAGAWLISGTNTLWTDFSEGRILHNPATGTSYFIVYIGNALKL